MSNDQDFATHAAEERRGLLERIHALEPMVRARADDMERMRHMPPDLARALADTGVYRMLRPADIGGLECPPTLTLQAIEAASVLDASTGWCAMIGATSGIYSAYLPRDLARDLYGEGNAVLTGGVFAPMGRAVADGADYVVSGHWRWASGSRNCHWLNGGCTLIEDGQPRLLPNGTPEVRAVIFPIADVELVDTWHTMGLAGTGSVDMKATNVRVPKARSVSLMADKPRAEGALFVFPVFGLLAMGIAAVASGNARAALDEFRAFAADARTGGARRALAERATVQQQFAQAEAEYRAARALLFGETEAAWEVAQREHRIPIEMRARLRLAATHMTRSAAEVCRTMHDLSGGAAVFSHNLQQRRLRDAQTMTAHMMIAPPTYELTGRVLLGLPTDDSAL